MECAYILKYYKKYYRIYKENKKIYCQYLIFLVIVLYDFKSIVNGKRFLLIINANFPSIIDGLCHRPGVKKLQILLSNKFNRPK